MFFKRIREDIESFMARDPAARSRLEVVLCYPGFHAILIHRLAAVLWRSNLRLSARFLSHLGKLFTGIELHPGARIGRRLVIDHGIGVVVGETAIIGDDVTLYQGVTLGGVSPAVDSRSQVNVKRHPTLMDGVIVGSGAQILGPLTIGTGARVGANAVVTKDIPVGVTAIGIPAQVVMPRDRGRAQAFVAYGTPTGECVDPLVRMIDSLRRQVAALLDRVEELEERVAAAENNSNPAAKPEEERKPLVVSGGKRP